MGTSQSFQVTIPQESVWHWGWFLAFGIALLVAAFKLPARRPSPR
jgi:hypothetical protein